ncbi:MAG: trypsin-like peptidase domain-containing protein [Planctomycetes bacterium]|nr:trypsin-like peptidase domain-containing protein [Planctomycetota bacterium]
MTAFTAGALAQDTPSSVGLYRAQQDVFRAAINTINPSIVRIQTIGGALPVRRSQDGKRAGVLFRQADGPTTGVIWSADGYIITSSFNFLRDPRVITVTLHDGRTLLARLIARDRPARLALLKVEADHPLPVPRIAESDKLRPGQWALAAGHGFGSRNPAMSVGIISALNRKGGLAVQTDAKVSPANYGGPLFDIEGALIGVCVPMGQGEDETAGIEWYDSGISFAVHTNRIRAQFERLKRGEDVQRGLMGVILDNSDSDPRGVPIMAPPVGPAAAAGLQEGDLITTIDGQPTPTYALLKRALSQKAAGDAALIGFLREGRQEETGLTLVRREELNPPAATQPASAPAGQP